MAETIEQKAPVTTESSSVTIYPSALQDAAAIKDMFEDYKKYLDGPKRQAHRSKTEFSWDKMKDKVDELFTKYIPEFPKQVELKLPQLKKIELPKLQKVEK